MRLRLPITSGERSCVMNWKNPALYFVGAILTLGPVGLRVLTWPAPRTHDLEPSMVEEGRKLFLHEWAQNDPLCPDGDGLGPVFNATSCVACHQQGGVGGGGGLEHNVTTFLVQPANPGEPVRQGVVHRYATDPSLQETLAVVDPELPNVVMPTLAQLKKLGAVAGTHGGAIHISQRNTPALFGAKLIDELPERVIIAMERSQRLRWGLAAKDDKDLPVGRVHRLEDGRIG